MKKDNLLKRVFNFYYHGFSNMSRWGKQIWLIIFIKLFIMFAILKLFFFPNFLKSNFDTKQERGDYVIEQMTAPANKK